MDFLDNKKTLPAMPVPPQFPGSKANPILQAILHGVNELREKAVTHELSKQINPALTSLVSMGKMSPSHVGSPRLRSL